MPSRKPSSRSRPVCEPAVMPMSPTLPLPPISSASVSRRDPGGADVVGGDVGVGRIGIDAGVEGDHRHAALDRLLDRRRQRLGVGRGDQDPVDLAHHHVVDQVDLAGDVGLLLDADVENVVAELLAGLLGAALDREPERRVGGLRNPGQRLVLRRRLLAPAKPKAAAATMPIAGPACACAFMLTPSTDVRIWPSRPEPGCTVASLSDRAHSPRRRRRQRSR